MPVDNLTALCTGPCRPTDKGGPRRTMPGTTICDTCEERCWENLHYIADHWPDLEQMLTRPASSAADGMPRKPDSEETGIDLNEAVIEARHNITQWLHYWTRVILDDNPGFEGPPDNPIAQARYIARHTKRIIHGDQQLATALTNEAHRVRKTLRKNAFPTGARLYRPTPAILCTDRIIDNTTDDTYPCPGDMRAWITDSTDGLPDLTCWVDPTHILTPAGFKRTGRAAMKEAGARRLAAAILNPHAAT